MCFFSLVLLAATASVLCAREYQPTSSVNSSSEYNFAFLTDACASLGNWVPARIETAEQNAAAWMTCNDTTCWIDIVRDNYTTTNWYHLNDGAYNSSNPITYFNWALDQPTSARACVALDNSQQFAGVGCNDTARPTLCMPLTEFAIVFGFKTTGGQNAESYESMTITFYWGDLMFQCERIPEFKNTLFTCNSLNSTTVNSTKQCVNLPA
eukprot:175733_1